MQAEEDVVAGVDVEQVGEQVQPLPRHAEQEGDDVGEELGAGETEVQGQQLAADGQVGVLRVVTRGVNPVELIGSRQQPKFFENELELRGRGRRRADQGSRD